MGKISEEKRTEPRVKMALKAGRDKAAQDISESGLSFSATETISSPMVSLQISFPGSRFEFKTDARLVWNRNLEKGSSLYGVEFIALDERQKAGLREELIRFQIKGLLNEIEDTKVKKEVAVFFFKTLLDYIDKIHRFMRRLSTEEQYSSEAERELERLNDEILLNGYGLELLIDNSIIMDKVKERFRFLVGVWAYKSPIVKRAFEKPRGYPGDYRMLEIVYDNKPVSKQIGLYFDRYFLKSPYAVAVRTRKDRIREILRTYLNESRLDRINILNIACGSCREIQELLPNLKIKGMITFTCLDWDEEALKFSQDALLPIKPENAEFKFVKEHIAGIIDNGENTRSLGRQHLIYSVSLMDYLPDGVFKKLIFVLYQLLQNDGKLILTHKNSEKTFPPITPDWLCDWKFLPRDKDEVSKLFYNCGISDFSLLCSSDDFGYIYYFTLTKTK